jgi:hypothetical protein
MIPDIKFKIEGDRLVLTDLPAHLRVRRIVYNGNNLAVLKQISIASANIQLAKAYMDSILSSGENNTHPSLWDAAVLAAIVKYASVFKVDSSGAAIDATKIFSTKVRIATDGLAAGQKEIDDPEKTLLKSHNWFIRLRDKFVAHDDRRIGNTDCFAVLNDAFDCEHVFVLTERAYIHSAIKTKFTHLPMCIGAVLTWLASEKTKYCQIVCDEINKLKAVQRERFPEPVFEAFKGLPDSAERKAKRRPYWTFDWETGEMKIVDAE